MDNYRVVEIHDERLKIQCKEDDFEQWGAPVLTHQQYQRKELLQRNTVFSKNHSVFFALVDVDLDDDSLSKATTKVTMYCHCEAHRFDCLVKQRDGQLHTGFSYHIASVYTLPLFRGRKLARFFLQQVALQLQLKPQALASVLYSDIGPKFYDQLGWKLYPSETAVLTLAHPTNQQRLACWQEDSQEQDGMKLLLDQELEDFLVSDSLALQKELLHDAKYDQQQVFVPLATRASVEWQFVIGKYYASIRGLEETKQCGLKLADDAFVVWCHNFKESTLFIVRARFPSCEAKCLQLLDVCLQEAHKFHLKCIKLWDPPSQLLQHAKLQKILHMELKQREDSLSSLMLFNGNKNQQQEPAIWLCNEKFAWV